MKPTQPTYFLSHGGGPWPWIPEMRQAFSRTADWLEKLPGTLPEKPRAVLSISGHWEERAFVASAAAKPPMLYDYSGFPAHTYEIRYPAPGAPELAARVEGLVRGAGLPGGTDPSHGFDHGTFVPLALMYPRAEIPVLSLSINNNYSVEDHLALGRALRPLREEGVLILGSGLSFHNLRAFGSPAAEPVSRAFNAWLKPVVETAHGREANLATWEKAPGARQAHPQEDHLVPLFVAAGAACGEGGTVAFVDHVYHVEMASYRFG